jgi:steroid 5-alpha reductase family enzyme
MWEISMGELLIVSAVVVAALMVVAWLASLLVRDASIVDMIWGLGFVVVAWVTYLQAADPGWRGLLLTAMVTVWGLRLSGYLVWRNLGKPEDFRYQEMRAKAPHRFWLTSLFRVFLVQGTLIWVISVPVVVSQSGDTDLYWLDYLGVLCWGIGLLFEAVGDIQLARFKAGPDSKGKVMDRGLWRYTRHPNYFGDFSVWWGHYLVAAAGGAWWTIFSPVMMSFLLLRVSGVALLEKTISERRPEYEEYARRTNAFFPGPPKRG